jgi:hypothetical protein
MQRQIVTHLAGGVGEAVHRGERRKHQVLRDAMTCCAMDADLQRERALLVDLRRATGLDFTEQAFAEQTLAMA